MADNPKLKSYTIDLGLLILRVFFGGVLMTHHGWAKFQMLFSGADFEYYSVFGIGDRVILSFMVFAEFICAFLVLIGFMTRIASMPVIITMVVTVFVVHWGADFSSMEVDILNLGAFLTILYLGAGAFSVDNRIARV